MSCIAKVSLKIEDREIFKEALSELNMDYNDNGNLIDFKLRSGQYGDATYDSSTKDLTYDSMYLNDVNRIKDTYTKKFLLDKLRKNGIYSTTTVENGEIIISATV